MARRLHALDQGQFRPGMFEFAPCLWTGRMDVGVGLVGGGCRPRHLQHDAPAGMSGTLAAANEDKSNATANDATTTANAAATTNAHEPIATTESVQVSRPTAATVCAKYAATAATAICVGNANAANAKQIGCHLLDWRPGSTTNCRSNFVLVDPSPIQCLQ